MSNTVNRNESNDVRGAYVQERDASVQNVHKDGNYVVVQEDVHNW